MTRRSLIALTLTLALLLFGCGSGGTEQTATGAGDPELTIRDVTTPEPAAPDVAAVYLIITNDGGEDLLIGAASDVAGTVEVHESIMEGGMARMEPVEGIPIPAGGRVALERGGYHVMLLDVTEPLELGDRFDVTLTFDRAGDITVTSTVTERIEDGMGDGDTGNGHGG
jgi:periplasmic copper chaperone A